MHSKYAVSGCGRGPRGAGYVDGAPLPASYVHIQHMLSAQALPRPAAPYSQELQVKGRPRLPETWLGSRSRLTCQVPCITELGSLCLLLFPWSSPLPAPAAEEREEGRGHLLWRPLPMEQTAAPGGPWLPCSHRQALALYQHLFGRPAALGQLQAALQQVREVGHGL